MNREFTESIPAAAELERAGGVLLGQAIGDALGVPYEFAPLVPIGEARMIGGGLGPYKPGEWSDDTQMAVCIARVSAAGSDLATDEALDRVAEGFLAWERDGASDIGNLTATVLRSFPAGAARPAALLANAAARAGASGSAGNGALMRTAIVGLTALRNPQRTAAVAARVAALTHADPRCIESAVLWSEAVRVAVVEARLDVRGGLRLLADSSRAYWQEQLDAAESQPPQAFNDNGYTVTALQAAWSAIWATRDCAAAEHVEAALQTAIGVGNDTDTVAAIAGGLLGGCYGVSSLRRQWVEQVHGWPGMRAADLVGLAQATACAGNQR
ncbi:MAG: ADP-ribosylglycohydrolase family protein [Arachnia sp.]